MITRDSSTFKILCIDGGGIKGLYSATLIKKLEEHFQCKMTDKFDMICGTSTGGLIAMALASGVPINEICNLYLNNASKIFSKKWPSIFPGILFKSKYKNNGLRSCLEEIFKDKTLGDTNNLLCIPSYSVTNASTVVFKNRLQKNIDLNPSLGEDNNLKLVDVALATSAAPTYFPMANFEYKGKSQQFIDGAVWANNPSMVGIIEALNYFVNNRVSNINSEFGYKNIEILSISSLNRTEEQSELVNPDRAFINWGSKLFDVYMKGNSDFNHYFLEILKKDMIHGANLEYLRIPSPILTSAIDLEIEIDSTDSKILELLVKYGNEQFEAYKNNSKLKQILKDNQTLNFNASFNDV